MPSMSHEGLLRLIRANPRLVLQLAAGELGISDSADVRTEATTFSEIEPAEYSADAVLRVSEPGGGRGRAVIIEIQLRRDPDKPFTWPQYITGVRCRLRCPVALLVIAIDRNVARWCARAIHTGHQGFVLHPMVLGPDRVPVITDVDQARELTELAVLSVAAHGSEPGAERIALAALAAASALDSGRGALYADLVYSFLSEAARRALETLMQQQKYEYLSEFARRYVAQGRAKGEAEGRAKGEAEGRAKGEARGRAQGLLLALEIKGFEVTDALRERILSCTDSAQFDVWYSRVKSAQRVEDVFA